MRQFARRQEVPPTRDMSKFCYDFGKDQPHDEEEIMKIWYGSKVSELNEMVEDRDRREVIPEYITWFHDPSSFRDRPEGSKRRRNDQRTIENLKEELEHAQMTIAKKQTQQQTGVAQIRLNIKNDYQSALRVMDKDINLAKNEVARLQEELANTNGLVRRVGVNKNAEIRKLQEDLSIVEEAMHQQQMEFDLQSEKFESIKNHQLAEFETEKRHYHEIIGRLQNDLTEDMKQRNSVLDREADALNLADARGQQIDGMFVVQENVKRRILEIAEYTALGCTDCEKMNKKIFIESAINLARHIATNLEAMYKDMSNQLGQGAPQPR
ncbi:uncharacterized protein [Nicotiana sylvestris]|uniref:Uncharacterized protein LOC104241172 n=1 Tax=Nicotiana sylvestris TaxID=4096 RepID=A0A1U7Y571_NICSY|nr:PREDICTED: uncharacterized protein LOC104241172 [Nicotiana sylvestris]